MILCVPVNRYQTALLSDVSLGTTDTIKTSRVSGHFLSWNQREKYVKVKCKLALDPMMIHFLPSSTPKGIHFLPSSTSKVARRKQNVYLRKKHVEMSLVLISLP